MSMHRFYALFPPGAPTFPALCLSLPCDSRCRPSDRAPHHPRQFAHQGAGSVHAHHAVSSNARVIRPHDAPTA
jgi:hypothetical protein